MFGSFIASSTVGAGGATSISFSSIPQTYTDLTIVVSGRHTSTGVDFVLAQLNTTTTGYTCRDLEGTGSAVGSYTQSSFGITNGMVVGYMGGTTYTANVFNSCQLLIPNYTGSIAKLSYSDSVFENQGTVGNQAFFANTSTLTSAVTSITLKCFTNSFAQYTTAYLYGTLKGSGGATAA